MRKDKKCFLKIHCPDKYSFHYAVVAHVQKLPEDKRWDQKVNFPFGDYFLSNPFKGGRGKKPSGDFVPEFKAEIDFSMLPAPVPDPLADASALREFQERNNLGVYVYDWHTHIVSDESGDVEISAPRFLFKPDKIYDDEVTLLYYNGFFTLIKDTLRNGRNAFFRAQGDENSRDINGTMRACPRCMDFFTHKASNNDEKSV